MEGISFTYLSLYLFEVADKYQIRTIEIALFKDKKQTHVLSGDGCLAVRLIYHVTMVRCKDSENRCKAFQWFNKELLGLWAFITGNINKNVVFEDVFVLVMASLLRS